MDTDSKVYRFERWALCQRKTGRANFLSDEGPTLETLDFAIRIGSTPTFSYFDLYLCNIVHNMSLNMSQVTICISIKPKYLEDQVRYGKIVRN